MKLRTKLLQFGVATIVPPLVLAFLLGVQLVQYERDAFRRGALDRNRAFMTAVDAEIGGHVAALKVLGASRMLQVDNVRAFRDQALRALGTQREWQSLSLSAASGDVLMNTAGEPDAPSPPVADPASAQRVFETAQPAVGNVTFGELTRTWGVPVRVPIMRDGVVKYALTARLDSAAFARLIEAQHLPPKWVSGLVDRSGHFIARIPPRSPADVASPDYLAAIKSAHEGWYRGQTIEGVDTYTAYGTSDLSGWTIGFGIPAGEVNAAANRAAWLVGLGALISVMVALFFAFRVGRRIAVPIGALAAAARSIGSGEGPVTVVADPQLREVREVAQALTEASAAIGERERLIEREQALLKAADKAKDEFLAMLGHELRNPLSAVSNAAALLGRPDLPPQNRSAAQAIITRQTEQLTRIVNDLLDMGRVVAGKIHLERMPVELSEIARAAVSANEVIGRAAPQRITIACPEPVYVDGDATRLEQVITNLVSNAITHTPRDGSIDISIVKEGDAAILRVKDTGAGIREEDHALIFELFYQADKALHRKGGLGIGLTLVKRLVEMHGGEASVFSGGLGQGSTFTITLPLLKRPPITNAAKPHTEEQPDALDVLVIDDSEDVRTSTRLVLEVEGHVVRLAADGPSGIRAALEHQPRVALVDIGMPGMDGYEVARELRKSFGDGIVLLATTGYGQAEDIERAMQVGFDAHMVKPVDLERLCELLARLSGRRETANIAQLSSSKQKRAH